MSCLCGWPSSLSLRDLLPSKLAKSLHVPLTSLCGCLTFSWGCYCKGKVSVLLLVDSSVMTSLGLALVLDVAHTLLTKTVDFSHILSGVLTVNQQLGVCYLVVLKITWVQDQAFDLCIMWKQFFLKDLIRMIPLCGYGLRILYQSAFLDFSFDCPVFLPFAFYGGKTNRFYLAFIQCWDLTVKGTICFLLLMRL